MKADLQFAADYDSAADTDHLQETVCWTEIVCNLNITVRSTLLQRGCKFILSNPAMFVVKVKYTFYCDS